MGVFFEISRIKMFSGAGKWSTEDNNARARDPILNYAGVKKKKSYKIHKIVSLVVFLLLLYIYICIDVIMSAIGTL